MRIFKYNNIINNGRVNYLIVVRQHSCPCDFRFVAETVDGRGGNGSSVADERRAGGGNRQHEQRRRYDFCVRCGRNELRRWRRLDAKAGTEPVGHRTSVVHAPQIGRGQAVGIPAARISATPQG